MVGPRSRLPLPQQHHAHRRARVRRRRMTRDLIAHLAAFSILASSGFAQQEVTLLVSASGSGVPGDGRSDNAYIAPSGRMVVFTSAATNLVPGDVNGFEDVFA